MAKRFIITESEKNKIRKMYGLIMEQAETPVCNDAGCSGTYKGPEFDDNGDVAHKYSNTMATAVGIKLKELYDAGTYVKVDMEKIKMSATSVHNGENSNPTVVTITIPFVKVTDKCEAYTSFDHVGGWGHTPELDRRKTELKKLLIPGETFDVSEEKNTNPNSPNFPNGSLNEYWIQWKEKTRQSNCKGNVIKKQTQPNQQPNQQIEKINVKGTDLINFRDEIKSQTTGKSLNLSTLKLDMVNLTFSVETGDTSVFVLALRWNLPNEKTCESCNNTVAKNQEYGAESVKGGNFEKNTRIYSLIVLYPKQ